MKRRTFIKTMLGSCGTPLLLSAAAGIPDDTDGKQRARVFLAADYGVKPITPAETAALKGLPADQGPAMLELIRAVNGFGGKATVVFESGDYHWLGEPLEKKGPVPSYPVTDIFLAHATFNGLEAITIDAPAVRFFFMDVDRSLFRFQHCASVTLRGFAVDYLRCASSVAEIVGRTDATIDLRFWDEFPVTGSLPVRQLELYDPATRAPVHASLHGEYTGHRDGGMDVTEKIADQTLRVHFSDTASTFPDHGLVAVKHRMYASDAFRFEYCREILCESVRIHSCSGMGFHADASHNVTLRHCCVEPPTGSKRLLSSNADASHVSHASGTVTLEDCRFVNCGDDGNNTLAHYLYLSDIASDRRTIRAHRRDATYLYPFPLEPGNTLEFVHEDDLATISALRVVAVELLTDSFEYRIRLAQPLPAEINTDDHRFCIVDQIPRYVARRVTCRKIRGRGLLCTGRDVLIEDCHFEELSCGGILCTADTDSWGQAATLRNVVIRRNRFINNNHARGPCFGEILIGSITPGFRTGSPDGNRDIRIEANRFENVGQSWLALMGVSQVDVRDNVVKNCMLSPLDRLARWGYGAILLDRVRDVRLRGNRLTWTREGDPKFTVIHLKDTPAEEVTDAGRG